ncbi:uncharacterized protein LOC143876737 [Tasmannia lanceolata]|uniref:uncharacterized protein LOC143876737 n=1 Tax=Tasmannia lanceolata TaxID=3420 RepID=UPI00406470A2
MAEEPVTSEAAHIAHALAPPKPTPNHPPYSQMICSAIQALNEKHGSSRKAIAKYIDEAYTNLPQTHSSLLTTHLRRLKIKGQVLMVKHSYKLPKNPNSMISELGPVRRGRGRPPNPKPAIPAPSPGLGLTRRGRGRPPKPKPTTVVILPRNPRGRPRKERTTIVGAGTPKRRGRPPKKTKEVGDVAVSGGSTLGRRPRGRPRKVDGEMKEKKTRISTGRPVGRPRKVTVE